MSLFGQFKQFYFIKKVSRRNLFNYLLIINIIFHKKEMDSSSNSPFDTQNSTNFRSISFQKLDEKNNENKKIRTKSFLRDSKLLDLELERLPENCNLNKKGYSTFNYKDPEDENSIIFESKYSFIEKYIQLSNYANSSTNFISGKSNNK